MTLRILAVTMVVVLSFFASSPPLHAQSPIETTCNNRCGPPFCHNAHCMSLPGSYCPKDQNGNIETWGGNGLDAACQAIYDGTDTCWNNCMAGH